MFTSEQSCCCHGIASITDMPMTWVFKRQWASIHRIYFASKRVSERASKLASKQSEQEGMRDSLEVVKPMIFVKSGSHAICLFRCVLAFLKDATMEKKNWYVTGKFRHPDKTAFDLWILALRQANCIHELRFVRTGLEKCERANFHVLEKVCLIKRAL